MWLETPAVLVLHCCVVAHVNAELAYLCGMILSQAPKVFKGATLDGPTLHAVFYFTLKEETAKALEDLESAEPSVRLLAEYFRFVVVTIFRRMFWLAIAKAMHARIHACMYVCVCIYALCVQKRSFGKGYSRTYLHILVESCMCRHSAVFVFVFHALDLNIPRREPWAERMRSRVSHLTHASVMSRRHGSLVSPLTWRKC